MIFFSYFLQFIVLVIFFVIIDKLKIKPYKLKFVFNLYLGFIYKIIEQYILYMSKNVVSKLNIIKAKT